MPTRIEGYVFAPDWRGIAGATVVAMTHDGVQGGISAVTNANGYFLISGLAERQWIALLTSGQDGDVLIMPPLSGAIYHRDLQQVESGQHHAENHLARHQTLGDDPLALEALAGTVTGPGHGDQTGEAQALHTLSELLGAVTDSQIPAAIMRDAEHTAIGDASPHHAAVTVSGTPNYITLSGQDIVRALINLASHVTGDLPYANLTPSAAISKLLGRGAAAGAGDWEEITLGTGLTMTGTTLAAAGGGSLEPIVLGIAGVLITNAQSWELPAPETGTYNTIVARITDDNRSGSGDVIVGVYKNGTLAQSITVAFGSKQNDDPLSPAISLTKTTDYVHFKVTTGQIAAANLVCQLLP